MRDWSFARLQHVDEMRFALRWDEPTNMNVEMHLIPDICYPMLERWTQESNPENEQSRWNSWHPTKEDLDSWVIIRNLVGGHILGSGCVDEEALPGNLYPRGLDNLVGIHITVLPAPLLKWSSIQVGALNDGTHFYFMKPSQWRYGDVSGQLRVHGYLASDFTAPRAGSTLPTHGSREIYEAWYDKQVCEKIKARTLGWATSTRKVDLCKKDGNFYRVDSQLLIHYAAFWTSQLRWFMSHKFYDRADAAAKKFVDSAGKFSTIRISPECRIDSSHRDKYTRSDSLLYERVTLDRGNDPKEFVKLHVLGKAAQQAQWLKDHKLTEKQVLRKLHDTMDNEYWVALDAVLPVWHKWAEEVSQESVEGIEHLRRVVAIMMGRINKPEEKKV